MYNNLGAEIYSELKHMHGKLNGASKYVCFYLNAENIRIVFVPLKMLYTKQA